VGYAFDNHMTLGSVAAWHASAFDYGGGSIKYKTAWKSKKYV